MNTTIAQEFLTRCFTPRRDHCASTPAKEKPSVSDAARRPVGADGLPRYLAWLRYENQNGANVYVGANPFRPGSRKRTKECIAEVRHLYIDIDMDGAEPHSCFEDFGCCSRSNHHPLDITGQVSGALEGRRIRFRPAGRHPQMLTSAFGGDSGLYRPESGTSRPRIPAIANMTLLTLSPLNISSGSSIVPTTSASESSSCIGTSTLGTRTKYPSGKNSPSEKDWAWVVQQLSHGADAGKAHICSLLPRGRTSPTRSTTRSAPWTSLPLVLLCSRAGN